MNLNELRDNPGARLKSKRLGRGIGSGEGQDLRQGRQGPEGPRGCGAERLRRRPVADLSPAAEAGLPQSLPQSIFAGNLGVLDAAIKPAKSTAPASHRGVLFAAGLASGKKDGVRLLADGAISRPITITVSGASAAAKAAVEAGGWDDDHHRRTESAARGSAGPACATIPYAEMPAAGDEPLPQDCGLTSIRLAPKSGRAENSCVAGVDKGTSHGLRCRTARSQPQSGRLLQGDRTQAAYLVHAGGAHRLPARAPTSRSLASTPR